MKCITAWILLMCFTTAPSVSAKSIKSKWQCVKINQSQYRGDLFICVKGKGKQRKVRRVLRPTANIKAYL